MKPVIDDLPAVDASRLRATGVIGRETKTTNVRFDDSEFVVEVVSKRLQRGGDWSMFLCPRCGRRCRKLRLFEDRPTCARCIRTTGMHYRIEMFPHASDRVVFTAAKRIARLTNTELTGIRRRRRYLHRPNVEEKLRRSLIVARQHALDEHAEKLAKLLDET